jgi:hypothetical protein
MEKEDLLRDMKEKIQLTIIAIIVLIAGMKFSEYFAISPLHEFMSKSALCIGISIMYSIIFVECCKPDKDDEES